jgi:hypothetical protein
MKTAMQELRDEVSKVFHDNQIPLKIDISKYLEKEKEQIIDANRQSRCNDCPFMYSNEDAEQYYNQTYNQNK